MYFLIYRSEAVENTVDKDLHFLLMQSRDRNKSLAVTGMLLFFENRFLQLLEGSEENVKQVYKSICADARHKNLLVLKEGPANQRLFPDWSMSFRTVSLQEIEDEPAYKNIYIPGTPGAADLVSLFNKLRGKQDASKHINELE